MRSADDARPPLTNEPNNEQFNELLKPSGSPSSDTGVNGGFEPITTKIVPEGPDQVGGYVTSWVFFWTLHRNTETPTKYLLVVALTAGTL